ncbi:cell division protein FtsW [Actinobacillus equuli]|nr:cell division protein FtsW [Actinobacillus equuli]
MAVVGEEFGFIGIVAIVILLVSLALRALKISKDALKLEERFRGFLAFGIAIWIFLQGFVNLGVASGLLPTKGLTFPLVSYGGSSLVIMSIAIAILLRIDYENRLALIGHAQIKEI